MAVIEYNYSLNRFYVYIYHKIGITLHALAIIVLHFDSTFANIYTLFVLTKNDLLPDTI